jgi:enamine deaminase RidA (YjgF/YER057c/UK114 family)
MMTAHQIHSGLKQTYVGMPAAQVLPSPSVSQERPLHAHPALFRQPICTVHLRPAGPGQAYLVAQAAWEADATSCAQAAYGEIARLLAEQGLAIVQERLFGSLSVQSPVLAAREAALRAAGISPAGPLTYIQGQPPWGQGFAGVIIRAVAAESVWTIQDQDHPVGRGWRRGEATYLLLQNLQRLSNHGNGARDRPLQARRMIERAARLLKANGSTYRDVARTWFYLDDILAWYPEFNRARSDTYRELGLIPANSDASARLPASTGIRGKVSTGAAGGLDLLAVAGTRVRQLRSPAQPEALTYGSAFSRGALIEEPGVSLIQLSGTAAIDGQGRSLHAGDVRSQIDCTFEKIAALIGPAGAALSDTVAACVFVKRAEDAQVYHERAAAWGLKNLPAVVMVADVCREELLFEMDAELAFQSIE